MIWTSSRRRSLPRKNTLCNLPDPTCFEMPAHGKIENPAWKEPASISFPLSFFPDFLRRAQNADGGWGYHPGSQSSAEPTAWSILALVQFGAIIDETLTSASEWLRHAQLADGAWPTIAGKDPGCWVTALASLALLKLAKPSDEAVTKGVKWLCENRPAEGSLAWRLRRRWLPKSKDVVRQDHSLYGWGWTPKTASWVEPTAYALILLQNIPEEFYPLGARERIQLGERMLFDRACPGGGWNAGNPLVYGVPGVPRVGPTAWALLALRNYHDHAINRESLEWLDRNYDNIRSPGSLALAQMCLSVYGRPAPPIEPGLHECYCNSRFMYNIPVVAWASLAVSGAPDWLQCSFKGEA